MAFYSCRCNLLCNSSLLLLPFVWMIWRESMDAHYLELVPAVERGVIIGAFAMLVLAADGLRLSANQQCALRADGARGPQFRLSLVIVPWALLLFVLFPAPPAQEPRNRRANFAGVVASAIAILRYEETQRLVGATVRRRRADNATIGILLGIAATRFHPSCGGRFECRARSGGAAGRQRRRRRQAARASGT